MITQNQIFKYFVFYVAFIFSTSVNAQNLLNQPESVVYDDTRNQYLVSNYGNGNIIKIDSSGSQSI